MQLGIELALMGIGTVFVFLILLVSLTSLMSKLINTFENKIALSTEISDETLKAIITKAIQQHRL